MSAVSATVVVQPKSEPIQHKGYMALVRNLPCYRCGFIGFSQFCHSDEGKGQSLKSDCRTGWPGCGPHVDTSARVVNGCHYEIGTARVLPKLKRRAFEEEASRATRAAIRNAGQWPADLAPWPEDNEETA